MEPRSAIYAGPNTVPDDIHCRSRCRSSFRRHDAQAPARERLRPRRAPAISLPVIGERELRLDLFRGLALWLIFIDHLPPSLITWFTIRNYGFSDATEIFIFISGYTAAFVYGRALLESGFVVATARILRRAWQIYVAHVFLFTIFLAEISYVANSFENPLYTEEMGIMDFLKQPDVTIFQALILRFKPVNMDVLPLYIVLMLSLPLILALDALEAGPDAGAVGAALRRHLALRSLSLRLSERLLELQSARLAVAVRVRRLVRARRRPAHVGDHCRRTSRCGSASSISSPRST